MENEQDKTGYWVVGIITAVIIAYAIGFSSGKNETSQGYQPDHTDDQYQELYSCADVLNQQRIKSNEASDIYSYGGFNDIQNALQEIHLDTAGYPGNCPYEWMPK
jgi:hypothetical protein